MLTKLGFWFEKKKRVIKTLSHQISDKSYLSTLEKQGCHSFIFIGLHFDFNRYHKLRQLFMQVIIKTKRINFSLIVMVLTTNKTLVVQIHHCTYQQGEGTKTSI